MKPDESLEAIICLVLPVGLLLWLMWAWMRRRAKPQRDTRDHLPSSPVEEAIVTRMTDVVTTRKPTSVKKAGAVSTGEIIVSGITDVVTAAAITIARSIQSMPTSIVTQIGTVAQMTIDALGFVALRLQSVGKAMMLRMGKAPNVSHVITVHETYKLDIRWQREKPESYIGAQINLVDVPEPVKLDVLVEGPGLDVSGSGEATLEIKPGQQAQTSFEVTPSKTGATKLRVDFYRGTAWLQRLDLSLDVRSQEKIEELKKGASEETVIVETIESSLTLPASVPRRDRVTRHLHLRFDRNMIRGRTYAASGNDGSAGTAAGDDKPKWRPIDVTLSEKDLGEVNDMLRGALDALRDFFDGQIELEEDRANSEDFLRALDELALRGYVAFKRIFPRAEDREYVLCALSQTEDANLEISTDCFFLPWGLLCSSYDPHTAHLNNFWGFQYNISCVLTDARQKQSPLISTTDLPRISLFANPELDAVKEHEVRYFRRLRQEGRIRLWDWLRDVQIEQDAVAEQEQPSAFFEYLRNHESEVTHFACHAVTDAEQTINYYIELSSRLRVRILELESQDYLLRGSPVVVLNACGTGIRDPFKTSGFVRGFMLQGGRGVLATECDVPDKFASVFVQRLYDELLQGKTFGRALLETRRHFLKTYRNPLGLLYSAYMSLETKFLNKVTPMTIQASSTSERQDEQAPH